MVIQFHTLIKHFFSAFSTFGIPIPSLLSFIILYSYVPMKYNQLAFLCVVLGLLGGCKSSGPNLKISKAEEILLSEKCQSPFSFGDALRQCDFNQAQQLASSPTDHYMLALTKSAFFGKAPSQRLDNVPPEWQATVAQLEQAQAWEKDDFRALSELTMAGQASFPDEESAAVAAGFANLTKQQTLSFGASPFTLPMQLTSSLNPMVEVVVNGHTYRFWLDTGAGVNVISSKVTDKCNIVIPPSPPIPIGTSTSKKVMGQVASIEKLVMGDLEVNHLPCVVMDHKDLSFRLFGIPLFKVDGIIGWPLLKQLDLVFDYPKETLTIRSSNALSDSSANLGWYWQPFLRLHGNTGCPLNLYLDTGSATTFFYPSAYPKLNRVPRKQSKTLTGGAGGNEMMKVDQLDSCQILIDSYLITLNYAEGMLSRDLSDSLFQFDGVIGQDILSKGVFKMNAKARRFSFEVEE